MIRGPTSLLLTMSSPCGVEYVPSLIAASFFTICSIGSTSNRRMRMPVPNSAVSAKRRTCHGVLPPLRLRLDVSTDVSSYRRMIRAIMQILSRKISRFSRTSKDKLETIEIFFEGVWCQDLGFRTYCEDTVTVFAKEMFLESWLMILDREDIPARCVRIPWLDRTYMLDKAPVRNHTSYHK